jgi:6-phosphogluconolactonase (cycloisomerase 2 family)
VDPTNNFLYVLSEGSNQVAGFKIATTGGTLAKLAPPSEPTGSEPVSMSLYPSLNNSGQFLFVSNSLSDNITGFTLGTTDGSMGNPITVIAPAAPSGLAAN